MRIEDLYQGMKVRIVGPRGPIEWNRAGKMDKFIGEVVTIRETNVDIFHGEPFCRIEEDPDWNWNPEDFDPVPTITEPDIQDFESILNR